MIQRQHAYLLTFASLGVGVLLSLLEANWQWFSRSGSLVVVIGILLTSTQIIEELQQIRLRRWRNDNHADSWSTHDWVEDTQSQKTFRDLEDDPLGRGQGLFLLVIGTLIWGFGDLVGRLLSG